MSQHLQDRELTDLLFDVADAKDATAAKKHLQGCKTCKARQKQLRATIGQLESTKADFKASEDLIARTLRATRAEELPPIVLVPRKSVLELSRFFWLAAAAALVVAGVVTISTYTQGRKDSAVAMDKSPAQRAAIAPMVAPVSDELRDVNAASMHRKDTAEVIELASADVQRFGGGGAPSEKKSGKVSDHAGSNLAKMNSERGQAETAADDRTSRLEYEQVGVTRQAPASKAVASRTVEEPALLAAAAAQPVTIAPAKTPAASVPPGKPEQSIAMRESRTLALKSSETKVAKEKADSSSAVAFAAPPAAPITAPAGASLIAGAAVPAPAARFRADGASAPPKVETAADGDSFEFTTQRVPFILPLTSGAWILQQNVRVRASVSDSEARMDVSNHGALPIVFQLMPRRGTNILLQFEIASGSASNFTYRTR